jgi:hypothetical protein
MRLLINTASTLKGGGVQVAKSFIEECRNFPEHDYHIVLGTTLDKLINRERFPANFHFYAIGYRPATRVFSFRSADAFFISLEKKIQPEVVFTTSGPSYWRPKHRISWGITCRIIYTPTRHFFPSFLFGKGALEDERSSDPLFLQKRCGCPRSADR